MRFGLYESRGMKSTMETNESEVKIEKRQEKRVSVRVNVSVTSESNFFVGFADNVSEGGLFMATYHLLPIGEEIEIELSLPEEDKPILARGEVRWHRSIQDPGNGELVGFGAKFVEVYESDQQRLQEFVAQREPLFHPE